ncbi:MAG: hypothetical protein NUV56_02310 [Candidatus Uhrbacteria bacterium]|nr:hypothetical protein [Candidatus Uhrbacteria bacterium]
MLIVVHREDRLLQRSAEVDLEGVTGLILQSRLAHRALLALMDEKLVGKTFANVAEITRVLDEWPRFATGKGYPFDNDVWSQLTARVDVLSTVSGGPGGPFCFGHIAPVRAEA